jgi:YegS/Rv2252/BmrU family lipid kinase
VKTRAIVNPAANTSRAGRRWPFWQRKLEAILDPFDVVFTSGPGDATRLACGAVNEGYRRLIAAGGDGTVNEVLNGMMAAAPVAAAETLLCPLPLGTANELCRALGHLAGPDGALQALAGGHTRLIDVIRADFRDFDGRPATRYGYLVTSFGAAATISHRTSATRWLKKLGPIAYFLMTPVVTLTYQPRQVTVRIDDSPAQTRTLFSGLVASAENGGGGMRLAPGAMIDDGQLDFVAFGNLGRAEALFRVLPGIRQGHHVAHSKVATCRGRRFHFECSDEMLVDLDGETLGHLPLTVTVLERALRVPVPPEP